MSQIGRRSQAYLLQMIHCILQTKVNKKYVLWQRYTQCSYKILHISKFRPASRGSPCDSTALLFLRVGELDGEPTLVD